MASFIAVLALQPLGTNLADASERYTVTRSLHSATAAGSLPASRRRVTSAPSHGADSGGCHEYGAAR